MMDVDLYCWCLLKINYFFYNIDMDLVVEEFEILFGRVSDYENVVYFEKMKFVV